MDKHQKNQRPIDEVVSQTEQKINFFQIVSKSRIKLWKAMLFGFFIAGFVGALAFTVGLEVGNFSEARTIYPVPVPIQSVDLVIPDVTMSTTELAKPAGSNVVFSATAVVKNQGTTSALASYVRFCLDNTNCLTSTTGKIGDYKTGILGAGSSQKISVASFTATLGNHTLTVCADVNKTVKESNENNNCTTYTFSLVEKPDLIISSSSPEVYGNLVEYQMVSFAGYIINEGATGSVAKSPSYRFCIDNPDCLNSVAGRINNMDGYVPGDIAGGKSAQAISSAWSATAGNHTIYLCADVNKTVNESNESNNCRSYAFTIKKEEPLPDFIVESATFYNEWKTYEKVVVSNICNRGTANMPANTLLNTEFKIEEVMTTDGTVAGLEINKCAEFFGRFLNITPGNYNVTVTVDYDNKIKEYNENNNSLTTTISVEEFPVGDPDLVTENIEMRGSDDMNKPNIEGDILNFSGYIRNIGYGIASAPTYRFCIDNPDCLNSTNGRIFVNDVINGDEVLPEEIDRNEGYGVFGTWRAVKGNHALYMCADVNKSIVEGNENNNCGTQWNFTVGATPNLFTFFVESWNRTEVRIGEEVGFTVVVKNNVDSILETAPYRLRFCLDNTNCLNSNANQLGSIKEIYGTKPFEEEIIHTDSWNVSYPLGKRTITACADYENQIKELDENDNCATWEFLVGSVDGQTPVINNFNVDESYGTNFQAKILWDVSDDGGSFLDKVEVWRATGSTPTNWVKVYTKDINTDNNNDSGSWVDTVKTSGNYWYGLHVLDNGGNMTQEDTPIKAELGDKINIPVI